MKVRLLIIFYALLICSQLNSQSCKTRLDRVRSLYLEKLYNSIPGLIEGCLDQNIEIDKSQAYFFYVNSLLANNDIERLKTIGRDSLLNMVEGIKDSKITQFEYVQGFSDIRNDINLRQQKSRCSIQVNLIVAKWDELSNHPTTQKNKDVQLDSVLREELNSLLMSVDDCFLNCATKWPRYELHESNLIDSTNLTKSEINSLYEIAIESSLLQRKKDPARSYRKALKFDSLYVPDSSKHTKQFLKFYDRGSSQSPDSDIRFFNSDYALKPKLDFNYGNIGSSYDLNPGFGFGFQTNILSLGRKIGDPFRNSSQELSFYNVVTKRERDYRFNVNAGISYSHFTRRIRSRGIRFTDNENWFDYFLDTKYSIVGKTWILAIHTGLKSSHLINSNASITTKVENTRLNLLQQLRIVDINLKSKRKRNNWLKLGISYGTSASILFELNYFIALNSMYNGSTGDNLKQNIENEYDIRIENKFPHYFQLSFSTTFFGLRQIFRERVKPKFR